MGQRGGGGKENRKDLGTGREGVKIVQETEEWGVCRPCRQS